MSGLFNYLRIFPWSMAAIRLPEHSHCKFCGDPIPFGEEYCDDECRAGEEARVRKERNKDLAFYVISGITIVVILVLGYIL